MDPLPYWNHIDNGTGFVNGSPPGISEGGSAYITLLFACALDKAATLLNDFNCPCDASRFVQLSESLKRKTMELCYSDDKQLIAETPAKKVFSQNTNTFAILTDTFDPEKQMEYSQGIPDSVPHPLGKIFVSYKKLPGHLEKYVVYIPDGLTGNFTRQGKSYPLKAGENAFQF